MLSQMPASPELFPVAAAFPIGELCVTTSSAKSSKDGHQRHCAACDSSNALTSAPTTDWTILPAPDQMGARRRPRTDYAMNRLLPSLKAETAVPQTGGEAAGYHPYQLKATHRVPITQFAETDMRRYSTTRNQSMEVFLPAASSGNVTGHPGYDSLPSTPRGQITDSDDPHHPPSAVRRRTRNRDTYTYVVSDPNRTASVSGVLSFSGNAIGHPDDDLSMTFGAAWPKTDDPHHSPSAVRRRTRNRDTYTYVVSDPNRTASVSNDGTAKR